MTRRGPGGPRNGKRDRRKQSAERGVIVYGRAGIAGALAMCVLAACSSTTSPEAHAIEGYWTWVRAFGGIAGMEITPQTTGYTMAVEFTGGQARVLRNDTLFAETEVEIRNADAGGQRGTVVYRDPVLGWPEQEFQIGVGDTLTLVDGCCDGFAYTFARRP